MISCFVFSFKVKRFGMKVLLYFVTKDEELPKTLLRMFRNVNLVSFFKTSLMPWSSISFSDNLIVSQCEALRGIFILRISPYLSTTRLGT